MSQNSILKLVIILVLILLIALIVKLDYEMFSVGKVFHFSPPPPNCNPDTYCFKGQPSRNMIFTNLCEPKNVNSHGCQLPYGQGLLKTPRSLQDTCIRKLE